MLAEEKVMIASVNAAILLARTLVHARKTGDPAHYVEIVDRARYCQLLATRLKLPLRQAHLVDLVAWVSGLDPQDGARLRMVHQHHLDKILSEVETQGPTQNTEAQILRLVMFYQSLKRQNPAITNNLGGLQKSLDSGWAVTADQQRMVRYLAKILRDEVFLLHARPAAGRILIVDPEEAVSPVLAPTLTIEGYEVQVTADASSAVGKIAQSRPDLIICELDMPLVDGLQFFRQVRENPETAGITFIMTASKKSKVTARNCLREGVDEVLTKPVDLEMLFLRLKKLLARPEGHAATSAEPHAEGGVVGSLADMSFADLVQMVTASAKSMTMEVTSKEQKGEVVVLNGEVVHCKAGDMEGEVAFYQMMRWQEGNFVTRRTADCPKRTINAPVMSLLMEGARLADEGESGGR